MTSFSIAASCLTALCCGLVVGRCLRGFHAGAAVASATASAAGLALLQVSKASDVLRFMQPRVALDWLPLICLLVAAILLLTSAKQRIAWGVTLAILAPIRLLWGSIHLQPNQLNLDVMFGIAVWSAALAIPVLLQDQPSLNLNHWKNAFWIANTVGSAMAITASGSLTYGVATGVCGFAILGGLIATSEIANISSVPIICLIGMSVSFAELPVLVAGLLFSAWCGVMVAERVSERRVVVVVRVSTAVVLLCSGWLTFARLTKDHGDGGEWNSGYHSFDRDIAVGPQNNQLLTQPSSADGAGDNRSARIDQVLKSSGEHSDPFDGFDL